MDPASANYLGIDVGSVSLCLAEVSPGGELLRHTYEFHRGDVAGCLGQALANYDLTALAGIAATVGTPDFIKVDRRFDDRVALITAARHGHRDLGGILQVGGERFGLIRFDRSGNYRNYHGNTSCAAGTGSFLDQQARRLNLAGAHELSRLALTNQDDIPKIASRCAVFAKTDLVHAQQEGYTLPQICDGLCHGLAKNVLDTLFRQDAPQGPMLLTGGVSRNQAVRNHISRLTGRQVLIDEHCVHGALGAALCLASEQTKPARGPRHLEQLIAGQTTTRQYHYAPLSLERSVHPDFEAHPRYLYQDQDEGFPYPVEVDAYQLPPTGRAVDCYLGVDVGSTSTKAVLLTPAREVLAGFYTRTAGRPVRAVQKILAALDDMAARESLELRILGAGTTGSGRKLAGEIIGADTIIDEITAHARAAHELDPTVDTIIEIGGQDSKFTTLSQGRVTFSVMNNVCAAGTGSFIEELALRLGCPLEEIAGRAMQRRSPISSDRCTVFMERDINYYLREGYSADEALASVLHSIIENYLTKVAVEKSIGQRVCFQGATAKNRALVAAFEQRLGKPIHVSRYCHLTGALGVALLLADEQPGRTAFRGIGLHKTPIPIRSEVCELCTNHCKITSAQVDGRTVAFGFLCGRDYDTQRKVDHNPSGFDLLARRKKALPSLAGNQPEREVTIGLPAGLHLMDEMPLWRVFFSRLGFRVKTSLRHRDAVKKGKRLAGAEFCAPMTAWHGHIEYLLDRADYVFAPNYLERHTGNKRVRRQYCYYTQYAAPLAGTMAAAQDRSRLLTPLVHYLYNRFHGRVQLHRCLSAIAPDLSFMRVNSAYNEALKAQEEYQERLRDIYLQETAGLDGVHVVLLGRPYTVLSETMNKGVPRILANLGIKAFYQDMLPTADDRPSGLQPLMQEIHWHFSARILEAAETIAQTSGAYPVLVTSFKCTPDSFTVEYFKKVMEAHGKPYLILQLDDHDSSVGYETRIEAAVRTFVNHQAAPSRGRTPAYGRALRPAHAPAVGDKTIFLPNWDPLSVPLLAANLRRLGLDARVLQPDQASQQRGLRHNTGQCIPLNIIAQEFMENVTRQDLDPARTVLWMPESSLACNFALFPHHIKCILDEHGQGMQKAEVYVGMLSFLDISLKLPLGTYFALMFGGMLRRLICKTRPYELELGSTDQVAKRSLAVMLEAFEGSRSRTSAAREVTDMFRAIATERGQRPQAALFGDLYVRDNEVMNQDLARYIEEQGGEVITTPYNYYLKMIAGPYLRKWVIEGDYKSAVSSEAFLLSLARQEKAYYQIFQEALGEPMPRFDQSPKDILGAYNLRLEHTGESMDNVLKIFYLLREHPDIALFVQLSPAFCCPSLVTEAMAGEIERQTGVPVVSITYDGTGGLKNDAVAPYLRFARARRGTREQARDQADSA